MTRSSKHKSHKQSKRSSKQSSDSEEDVKMKKSSKDENLARVHKESVSGEKRKISSQVQEIKDIKDLSGPYVSVEKRKISSLVQENKYSKDLSGPSVSGEKRKISSLVQESKDSKDLSSRANGEASKRRKEKADPAFGGDRWNGGAEERAGVDRNVEKELSQRGTSKIDSILKEDCSKGESLRIESKKKSRRHGSGSSGEKNDEDLVSVVPDKEESKTKVASKKKAERDSSGRKEGKEHKHKDRRSENEMNVGEESVLIDMDIGKKQASGDFSEERQGKRDQDNTEHVVQDELRNPGLEKENKKKTSSRREGFSEREMQIDDSKHSEGKGLSSRDRAKDLKLKDEKVKDGSHTDKYPENGQKSEKYLEEAHKDNKHRDDKHQKDGQRDARRRDDGQMNEKYFEEVDKDNKHLHSKYGEDSEKDPKRKEDGHREDGDRMDKRRDEKHREDGERERRRKDDKYREEREHKDDKYFEDGSMESRRRNDQYREDGDKDIRRGEDMHYEDGGRDDRRRDGSYRKEGVRDNRQKDGKYREDVDQDKRHKDMKSVDDVDRDKRPRDSKSRDEHIVNPSGEQSDPKCTRDDGYAADHHSRKSKGHGESPVRDDRPASYQDDHDRRRTNEKENYSDLRSRSTKDQKSYGDKRGANSGRIDPLPDKGRSTSRNAEIEITSSHTRRQSSPSLSSHPARDHYRGPKQDDSKYRDYSYDGRGRHNTSATRDSAGRFDQISSSRSLEKLDQKVDGRSIERRVDSDIRSSSTQLMDKSQPLNTDRRRFGRSDSIRSIDTERSLHRSGGSRDSSKEVRGSREDLMGDERPQADVSNFSGPSPFARNNNFTSGSKSIPHPPPYSPNSRYRRNVDPNMGRAQGNNNWRGGIPSWPSPGPGGFLPFPTPPPGFHPFHVASPMLSPFALPRFPVPGQHMGWHNQMDVPFNGVFLDNYPRPDWNQMSSGRGSDILSGGDMWKGPNRSASVEMASSEKGNNNSTQSPNESSDFRSIQPAQTLADQQVESTYTSQSTEKNDIEALPITTLQETSDIANMSKKDDVVHHSYVYFSKLDISTDLSDPELLTECKGLMAVDPSSSSVRDDYKILYVKEAVEINVESPSKYLSRTLFPSADESVFQKAMSLYNNRMDRKFEDNVGDELNILPGNTDENVEDNNNLKIDMEVDSSPPTDAPEVIKEEPIGPQGLGLKEYDPVSDIGPSGMEEELKVVVDVKCVVPLVEESVLVNLTTRIHDSPESTH